MTGKKIGSILADSVGLSDSVIDRALEQQMEQPERLGTILQDRGEISEEELLGALASQFDVSYLQSLSGEHNSDFVRKIPILFLKKNVMVPIQFNDQAYLAVNDPTRIEAIDELCMQLDIQSHRIVLAPERSIIELINHVYGESMDRAEDVIGEIDDEDPDELFSKIEQVGDLLDDTSDSPVIRLVNLMLSQAIRQEVSDIHIEPYRDELKIRQRMDGVLYEMFSPPKHAQSSLISRIKLMAKMNIAEKRLPQDGRFEVKIGNRDVDIRVSTLPTAFGERVVLRLLDKSAVKMSLADLGMGQECYHRFRQTIHSPNGMVLVTGPTGSGKTTTLYAALGEINRTEINIITVEDPIEYRIRGISQVQVNPKIDLTFANGLRSIVRQDPDVILIGEIRDYETAEIAIQSSLTGHLVFSTLHTNDSLSTITRLKDMGVEPYLITSSVKAILAQRLVRRLCLNCRAAYLPSADELTRIGLNGDEQRVGKFYHPHGCDQCNQTGYRGRCGIHEFLPFSEELHQAILQEDDNELMRTIAHQQGMKSLFEDGVDKVVEGITAVEEVVRVAQVP